MQDNKTITLYIKDLTKLILGQGYWHYRPIPRDLALTIFSITKNAGTCYVQFNDRQDQPLDEPILWDWAAWQQDCVGWEINKVRAHRQRVERFLLEANAKTLAAAWSKYSNIPEEHCYSTVIIMLQKKQMNKIKVFYNGPLKEKEEDL